MVYSLPPGKELERLLSLSEGIPSLLDTCDLVSPDSSFILYGIDGFYNYGVTSLDRYCRNKSKYFNINRLFDIYADISSGKNTRTELKELRDVLDENLLKEDVFLDFLLNQALQRDNFVFTERVYNETRHVCNIVKNRIDKFLEKKHRILPPGFKKRRFPTSMKHDPSKEFLLESGGFGRTISYLDDQCRSEAVEVLEETMKRLEGERGDNGGINVVGMNNLFDNVYNYNKILPSTRRFGSNEHRYDEDIIDTMLSNGKRVGIISCDYKDFKRKIQEVMEYRRRHELPNPEVFLLEPIMGLISYNLLEFSTEDFSPKYLKRSAKTK